jgi:hypothetical protein
MPKRKPNKNRAPRARVGDDLRKSRLELYLTEAEARLVVAAAARSKLPKALWARRVVVSAAENPS